jgi:hypothetical protein
MSHPILIAALAQDRRRWCPCGAVAQHPCDLCRECWVAAAWRRATVRTNFRTGPDWARTGTTRARFLAWVKSLLQIFGKGAEN